MNKISELTNNVLDHLDPLSNYKRFEYCYSKAKEILDSLEGTKKVLHIGTRTWKSDKENNFILEDPNFNKVLSKQSCLESIALELFEEKNWEVY